MDLFAAESDSAGVQQHVPLAERVRPRTLDEFVGQEHVLGEGKPLRILIGRDQVPSLILWGPPGSGKTTLARLIAQHTNASFVQLSAVTAGVKELRAVLERAGGGGLHRRCG